MQGRPLHACRLRPVAANSVAHRRSTVHGLALPYEYCVLTQLRSADLTARLLLARPWLRARMICQIGARIGDFFEPIPKLCVCPFSVRQSGTNTDTCAACAGPLLESACGVATCQAA